jgi:hypothetical protein
MKTGKELKVTKHKNYNISFGSINNKHSRAAYINLSTWAEPIDDSVVSYTRVIKDINKKIKQGLYNLFNNEFETQILKDRTIVDLDIRESGIKFGKRSFMNCEITLFMDSEIPVNSEHMKEKLDNVISMVVNSIFETNKTFKFHKKKN